MMCIAGGDENSPSSPSGLGRLFGSSKLKWEKFGDSLQALRFTLQAGEVLIGEAGCLLFMDDGIEFESRMGDGSLYTEQNMGFFGMLKKAAQRLITNESLFMTWFTNKSNVPRVIGVAAPMMGTIVPVDMHKLPQSTLFAQGGAYLCSSTGVQFSIELVKKFGAGLFGGEGFILQKLIADPGSPGQLFIHGGGTIICKELDNEELTLEPGCLMAFSCGIEYDIGFPGFKNAMLGGNVCMTKLRGSGKVWVQSTPSSKIIDLIVAQVGTDGSGSGGDVLQSLAE